MKQPIYVLRFSQAYLHQSFLSGKDFRIIDLSDIPGTFCYCDDDALSVLENKLCDVPARAIHMLDSGNYHYMTWFWLRRIQQPFRLLVFDHHTDLQPPAFGDILSCGGWISSVLNRLPFCRHVILVGPPDADIREVQTPFSHRISFVSQENFRVNGFCDVTEYASLVPDRLPLYLSIDKDFLCTADAKTGWSQGDATLTELLDSLQKLLLWMGEKKITLAGVDICGEADHAFRDTRSINERTNRALLSLFGYVI
jgi:arginase family enzyme